MHAALGRFHVLERQPAAALGESRLASEADRLQIVALAEHELGHAAASDRALGELTAKYGHNGAGLVAEVYAWRGDRDRSFEWLDRAVDQELSDVKYDSFLVKLRGDPRFDALLRKMKLPVQ